VYEINNIAEWQQQGGNEAFAALPGESKPDMVRRFVRWRFPGGEHFTYRQVYEEINAYVEVSESTTYNAVRDLEGIMNHNEVYQLQPTQVFINSFHAVIDAMNPRPPLNIVEIMLFIARKFKEGDSFRLCDVINHNDGRQRYLCADVKEAVRLLEDRNMILRVAPAGKPHDLSLGE